jgi:hypothetical protein
MGNVVGCDKNEVRFAFYLVGKRKGTEYFCAMKVERYEKGIIYLSSNIPFSMASCAAAAFLDSTSSIGTAKRILKLKKKEVVRVACIDLMQGKKPRRIWMSKNPETILSIEA